MKHPELLLLPVFMLLDYFGTVVSAVQQGKGYSDHFKIEHYELNPAWQKSVASKKWFSPKHLLVTAIFSSAIILPVELVDLPEFLVQWVAGCVLVLFAAVLSRHIANLMIFRHIARNPDGISGRVVMSHATVLWVSLFQCITVCIPLVFIAVFSKNAFAAGGALGGFLWLYAHRVWIRKYERTRAIDARGEVALAKAQNEGS